MRCRGEVEKENKTVEYCMTFIEIECAHFESKLFIILHF